MIKTRNKTLIQVLLVLFSFISTKSICWDPRPTLINACTVFICLESIALWQQKPWLFAQQVDDEAYLELVEKRINEWNFILNNPTEEELISYRYSLINHYEKILEERILISKIFQNGAPSEIFALLDEEIKQHIFYLSTCKTRLDYKKCFEIDHETAFPKELLTLNNKIKIAETTLRDIHKHFQSYSSYQIECSLARQEKTTDTIFHLLSMFIFMYISNREIDSLRKYPNW